jgi:streptomycin 6-kinase
VSLGIPVMLPDGSGVVLEVQFPHREGTRKGAALVPGDGNGAICLLVRDAERHVLILDRCVHGPPLSRLEQDSEFRAGCPGRAPVAALETRRPCLPPAR